MKTLLVKEIECLYGGGISLSKRDYASLGCLGIGLAYGLINPVLGFAAGFACEKAIDYKLG